MTDTAIPVPDDAAERMARQAQAALDVFTRALASTARDAERGMQAFSEALTAHAEASAARWRVHALMPNLTMRGVMVHGYVPHKEA